jgi:hypothetical protein
LYVPSDRIVEWLAGGSVPNDCRLTLIGNANSLDVFDLVTVVYEDVCRFVNALFYRVDDFLWVVFVPSALISVVLRRARWDY